MFIDTETSGLPKKWDASYSANGNWPFIVQIAWVIYTRDGQYVKTENHYIKDKDYEISRPSGNIHGISTEFLEEHGEERKMVMQLLQQDLLDYSPLIVGHFLQLDAKMMGVGFHRAGLENPAEKLPGFCTMKLSGSFIRYKPSRYLKLGELYERVFNKPLTDQHNALTDARATAACFFELRKKGDIDESIIESQQMPEKKGLLSDYFSWILILLIFFVLLFMIFWR